MVGRSPPYTDVDTAEGVGWYAGMSMRSGLGWIVGVVGGVLALNVAAADRPQWGDWPSRNMVSSEVGLVESVDVASGKGVRWHVELGTQSYASPVVGGGRVLIGTNNDRPRDPAHRADAGVLACLDERTGELVWQLV